MSRLFRDVDGGRVCPHGSVVCIGAFDGLHLGHRALIGHTLARARALDCEAAVVSFEPLPREFFMGAEAPPRIASARDRIERLDALGVDVIGLLHFNAALAAMSPQAFVEHLLVGRLGVREVRIGADFRFGHRRAGDLALLQRLGQQHGFVAESIDTHELGDCRVSSSAVREALAAGELERAESLLGRPYSIANRVVHGKQLGRTLGYPTANLHVPGRRPALGGIFASWVHGVGEQPWPSVSSLGTRPTVAGGQLPILEAHLFDFDGDLYGRRIEVEFVAKLRDETKFADFPALVAQMDRDAAEARAILSAPSANRRMSA
jgi:riboflavin kinase / FMN adenylyltransferase